MGLAFPTLPQQQQQNTFLVEHYLLLVVDMADYLFYIGIGHQTIWCGIVLCCLDFSSRDGHFGRCDIEAFGWYICSGSNQNKTDPIGVVGEDGQNTTNTGNGSRS